MLFKNYVYVSSTSPVFRRHFEEFASWMMEHYLKPSQLAVDIGSNDGILLKPLKELGARVIGVDPAQDIAARATQEGIPTLPHFFTTVVAQVIKKKLGPAHVITANNMFAHTDDLDGILQGVRDLLAPEGVFVVEVAYVKDFLEQHLFDTVYHEHVSYYSVRSMGELVRRRGFEIIDVMHMDTHGGSLRVVMAPNASGKEVMPSVDYFLREEAAAGVGSEETYHAFAGHVADIKKELRDLMNDLAGQRKSIVGYGAPAKGNTLLNYIGIDHTMLEYIVDDSPYKQGLYTPGMHVPVASFERLATHPPDYVFILAWNFADAIIKKCTAVLPGTTKYIIPVPMPHIQ